MWNSFPIELLPLARLQVLRLAIRGPLRPMRGVIASSHTEAEPLMASNIRANKGYYSSLCSAGTRADPCCSALNKHARV